MLTISRFQAWMAWLLATLFYGFQYIIRVSPNVMMNSIMSKFGIDAAQFGDFCGRYYIGYCAMHIPLGILLDRVGPRIVMPICVLMSVAGTLPLIYADQWMYPVLGRILIGMGSSGAILGIFKVIRMGFPEDHFNRVFGWSVTVGLLGAIYGGQPVAALMNKVGWENVILLIGAMGVILAIAMVVFCPKHEYSPEERTHSVLSDIWNVVKNWRILVLCTLGGLMIGPLEGFADGWSKSFLRAVYHLDDNMSSFIPSLIFLGLCIGSPIYTYITERWKIYYGMLIVSSLAMGVGFILMLNGWMNNLWILGAFFSLVGFFSMYQIILIYKSTLCLEERLVGLVSAYANMIIMLFGTVFHSSIGSIMNHLWDNATVNQVPIFSPYMFLWGLAVIPIGQLIAALGVALVKLSKKFP